MKLNASFACWLGLEEQSYHQTELIVDKLCGNLMVDHHISFSSKLKYKSTTGDGYGDFVLERPKELGFRRARECVRHQGSALHSCTLSWLFWGNTVAPKHLV